ncbi:MAG: ABC transporter permease, partial [Leptothrix sp. (in: b-proteobacteria)]
MIVPLARKTLLHEWRRFLPAVVAVAFSGLLLLVQAALVLGIFGSAAVHVDASAGDLWVGRPGTQSVELGRPLPIDTALWVQLDPAVARVESFRWVDGDWRGGDTSVGQPLRGAVSVFVSGLDTRPDGLLFAHALSPALRMRLAQPDAVIVDRADLGKLGVAVGDRARLNGHAVQVIAAIPGLRALGGANVLTSLDTAARLQADERDDRSTYLLLSLHDPAQADAVAARLQRTGARQGFEVWTRIDFAQRSSTYWMFETGAGLGVLFLAGVVCLVGAVITSQTLMGAVAGSAAEYAALQALGIGVRALRAVVLEQAAWVGAAGLVAGAIGAALALALARQQDVPVALDAESAAACIALVMAIAMASGWTAVRA